LAARGSHTPTGTTPTPSPATNFLIFILLFLSLLVFFWAYLFIPHVYLCHSVGVPSVLYTHPTTLTRGPDSSHPCHKYLGLHLQKHRLRVLSFLVLLQATQALFCCLFFFSLCKFLHVSEKKKCLLFTVSGGCSMV